MLIAVSWVSLDVAADFIAGLGDAALARVAGADFLVSGDRHLTALVDAVPPVLTPRQFRDGWLETSG